MKNCAGYREENVLQYRGAVAGYLVYAKTSTDEQKKHDDFVDRMMEKATPVNRCVYCANGICAYVIVLTTLARYTCYRAYNDSEPGPEKRQHRRSIQLANVVRGDMTWFIDRRLNGKNKSMVNRSVFYAVIKRKLNSRSPRPLIAFGD